MKNLTLILDFSASLSVGLVDEQGNSLAYRLRDQGTRGETAHVLLEECLAEADRNVRDLAAIGVGVGPGSFTGIRVCAAMAQGLAFAERLPLYPFSSLAGILTGIRPAASIAGIAAISGIAPIAPIAAIAANSGRYFVRRPKPSSAGDSEPLYEETLLTSDQLLALGSPETVLATAGGFPDRERMRPAFAALLRHEETADFPALARLARSVPPVTDGVLRPNYLQASAAEEKRKAGEASR
jgi:tRNA threonylcarbamoyl adenosine modification protein YeaZ